ncbi:MAG: cysteine--tRNA ligase [Candidatus Magasanikbacteria bacterium CG11_big_fil_rev_8_21_14_0_20_39_34]|uniref:Cysteine--tRNA ligase n=1 Tax=Candidatus Magasanikbacteria bacterium CG11_big_fil_rev_8_21_14_0_20_39_34 TaxID=1974653 RepID=A0A2H0N5L1_9BACT|nr:MAG: cysteine--tRNA ligase [Candidatus Magasanikbacteria bacterium CG11_big_fil_rev_8_21_14_0_20_39_34]
MIHLFNTLSRKKEPLEAITPGHIGLYTCGPTVYNYVHIGNLRTYVFEDILVRALKAKGYQVNHVMNITDVGHITGDADLGEDKMEKGSKREGKSAWDIARMYTQAFEQNMIDLNILEPNTWCKATDHIPEQIAMVQTLMDKGFTYETSDALYFDTTKIDDYGKLANLQNQQLQAGARVEMGEKKNPHDFALWKWSKEGENRQMEWDAFGRKGFPGWHIECSAMAVKYLGEHFDIHCGGIDHIPVHHTNEIAQTEAATGIKPWVNFWLHGEFLLIDSEKMAKSGENFITLQTLKEKNIDPLAYRFFLLQTHYRKQLNFSFEALEAAAAGYKKLKRMVREIPEHTARDPRIHEEFMKAVKDDLNMPEALAVLFMGLKDNLVDLETIIEFDKILGLRLHDIEKVDISDDVQSLLDRRQKARDEKNWELADLLREEIQSLGYVLEDTSDGQKVERE